MNDIPCKNSEELLDMKLQTIVDAASKIYKDKPVRILDLATGPNGFNPRIVNSLSDNDIDYELVLTDISPTWLKIGYNCLLEKLYPWQLEKVRCILADATNLSKDIQQIPIYTQGTMRPLDEVLKDSRFQFLQSGYCLGQRDVDFSDGSFDMVTGCIPYTSIMFGDYSDAITESLRVLKIGGYHIIDEMHVEEINRNIYRTSYAIDKAKIKCIDIIKSKLDAIMDLTGWYSSIYPYRTAERFPDQAMQFGDMVKLAALAHQKTK